MFKTIEIMQDSHVFDKEYSWQQKHLSITAVDQGYFFEY